MWWYSKRPNEKETEMFERNLRVRGLADGGTGKADSTGSHESSNITLRLRINSSFLIYMEMNQVHL